jgi:hypothetical protein
MVFEMLVAVGTVGFETAACLGADADALTLLDVRDVGADFDSFADDFVANDAGWRGSDRVEGRGDGGVR